MGHRVIRRAVAVASLCVLGCSWEWDRFVPNATGDAGTSMDAFDAPSRCAADEDCARASVGLPVCDTSTGRCVACIPTRDTCGAGRYCATENTCAPGCGSDQACTAAAADGGTIDGGVSAGRCDLASHACVQCLTNEHCPIGTRCTDRACVAGCDAVRGCPTGRTCCGGGCIDSATDATNCGACGALCSTVNGVPACAANRCGVGRCNEPFGDCDGDSSTGCETNTRITIAHCGGCGVVCAARANATATCSDGACAYACAPGFGDCDGNTANGCEVDLARTLTNCGRCGNECSFLGGVGDCIGGLCTRTACATDRGDCDGNTVNGCEVDLQNDSANCRMCGTRCTFPRATGLCSGGSCSIGRCDAGFDNCDLTASNGCETDLAVSLAHCGACGRSCAFPRAVGTCNAGVCSLGACIAGAGNCNGSTLDGCEVDFNTSVANCGSCGAPCSAPANATPTCAARTCGFACSAGFANCDGNAVNGCETNLLTNVMACGACGAMCALPNAVAACRGGTCAVGSCLPGFADCDGFPSNGCEVNTRSSTTDCGGCGRACAPINGVGACVASACTVVSCTSGFADCDRNASTGCEVQPVANNQNCGACGNVCASGRTCEAGRCAVASFGGYTVGAPPAGVVWIDACVAPGAVQVLPLADDERVSGTLSFPVEFWGTTNFTYSVSSNGWVGFGDYYAYIDTIPAVAPYRHFGALPNTTRPLPLPAAFIFGVDLVQGPRGICVATLGSAPTRRFVVQSVDSTLYCSTAADSVCSAQLPTSTFSYELIAYENSGNLDMLYNAPFAGPGGAPMIAQTNVTVGLQDYHSPMNALAYVGTITAATRIRFAPR